MSNSSLDVVMAIPVQRLRRNRPARTVGFAVVSALLDRVLAVGPRTVQVGVVPTESAAHVGDIGFLEPDVLEAVVVGHQRVYAVVAARVVSDDRVARGA